MSRANGKTVAKSSGDSEKISKVIFRAMLGALSFIIPIVGVFVYYKLMSGPVETQTAKTIAIRSVVSGTLGWVSLAIGFFGVDYLYYLSVWFLLISLEAWIVGIVLGRRALTFKPKAEIRDQQLAKIGFCLALSPFLLVFILLFIEQNIS